MKYLNIAIALHIIFCVQINLFATQRTLSNDANRPAQFSNLQAAIDQSSNGDTIIVYSNTSNSTNYNSGGNHIYFYKQLYVIGEGMNNTIVSLSSGANIYFNNLSNGSYFSGLRILSNLQFGGNSSVSNITFDRCDISDEIYFSSPTQNINIKNCQVGICYLNHANVTNMNFDNCIFQQSYVHPQHLIISYLNNLIFNGYSNSFNLQIKVKNSLFIGSTTSMFVNINGIELTNCIFYKADPSGTVINSNFNNCLTYLCNNNNLPPTGTGNTGANNVINQNPLFINFPALGGDFSWTHNYGLQAGSPADNTGTGGTDIGLTGGTYPLNQLKEYSKLPVVTSLSLPNSSVPLNGTLQGNIKAKVRN